MCCGRACAHYLRGVVSKSVKIPPLPRFSQLAEPVVEKRQERRHAHLDADGGAAELVVSLVIMLYIMVTSRALHHRAVTSALSPPRRGRGARGRRSRPSACGWRQCWICVAQSSLIKIVLLFYDYLRANGQERSRPMGSKVLIDDVGWPHSPRAGSRQRDDGARATSPPHRARSLN